MGLNIDLIYPPDSESFSTSDGVTTKVSWINNSSRGIKYGKL